MFDSQCLLSRKGPLRGVWVAAYCQNRLNKNHVNQTDISSSVDKIWSEGVPNITYRVLGYLLLGVVRIYSKKVAFLFDDCHEVLIKIKQAPIRKGIDAEEEDSLRAPFDVITLPERFELDAFDFQYIEDTSRCNVLPREDTMLKDPWKPPVNRNYFLDEYVVVDLETFSSNEAPAEGALLPRRIDHETGSPSHSAGESDGNMDPERPRDDKFSQGNNGPDFEMFGSVKESTALAKSNRKEQLDNRTAVPEMGLLHIAADETILDLQGRDGDASVEKLHDNNIFGEECQEFEMLLDDNPPDPVRPASENIMNVENASILEMNNKESDKAPVSRKGHALSVTVNLTPESKGPDASGGASPEPMGIATPATKERAQTRTLKKRKCLMDKEIVLSNKVIKEMLHDSSGLVSKRRKLPDTVLNVWKADRISNLSQVFSEPYTLCISPEFRFLLDREKIPTEEPVRIAGASKQLDSPRSPTFDDASRQTTFAPETPVQIPATKGPDKFIQDLDLLEPPIEGRCPQQNSGGSPTQFSVPVGIYEGTFSERARSDVSLKLADKETSSIPNQEFGMDLMNEETNSYERDSGKLDGWSIRTRMVAKRLHNIFFINNNKKGKGGEGSLNLTQVLRSGTRKESARFFYEILVLKSKEMVDVKQEKAYADIIIKETPALEETLFSFTI